MKKLLLIIMLFTFFIVKSQKKDSTYLTNKIENLENKYKQIEQNQLNYKIEKDLLKETYSNNYEKISLIITIILAVFGFLSYLGIKDISSMRDEYSKELNNLRNIQADFINKSKEFDVEKERFNNEIKEILKENAVQNNKIRFLELKEKIGEMIKEKKYYNSLEFINLALGISENDEWLLKNKAKVLIRLNQINESLNIHNKLLSLNPKNKTIIIDAIECMYFANDINNAEKLINENKNYVNERKELIKLFQLIVNYHKKEKEEMILIIKEFLDYKNPKNRKKHFERWDLTDAKYFIAHQKNSIYKIVFQNAVWYLDGEIDTETIINRLQIE